MAGPWEKYGSPEVVSQGGPWAKYGQADREWTPREAVDALPEWMTKSTDEKAEIAARKQAWEQSGYADIYGFDPKSAHGKAATFGAQYANSLTLGNADNLNAVVDQGVDRLGSLMSGQKQFSPQTFSESKDQARSTRQGLREANPLSAVAGDIAGFIVPGTGAYKGVEKGARALGKAVNPLGRTLTGSSALSRLGRYAPVVAGTTAASVGDYALYSGTVDASNRAAEQGRDPTVDEMVGAAVRAPTDPLAYVGGAISPMYRAGRGVVTAAKNTATASKQAGKFAPKAGSFTPTQRAQWASAVMTPKTPQSEAYKMIAKRLDQDGISPEQLHKAIDNYYYAGYSTVDEMLFEMAEAASSGKGGGQLKQLAVALGSVGGDAQQVARDNFRERRLGSLGRLRGDLRQAAGLEGSDFYQYADELAEAERTLPDYGPAYSQTIKDESWSQKLWPQIQASPSAREALDRAWRYASDRGDLEVAREIDTLVQRLGQNPARSGVPAGVGGNVPQKPSTKALDYIDRSLGGKAHSLRVRGDGDIASGAQNAQTSLRSVVDPETGLDQPRRVVHELKTAQRALDFGRKAAASGTDLETIQREFTREMRKFADDGVEVLGEETSTINASLMMGWIRGAEDMISKASNPGTAIRQLYGTPRQREKMVAMLEGLDESGLNLTSGKQSDATKRLRQLTGGKYEADPLSPQGRGRFDRERIMLDSENQIVGNSQTGQRNEAVAAQGGLERKINMALDAIDAPRQMAKKALRHGVNRLTRPGIYKPEVNRELGEIMFTPGRKHLQGVARQLDSINRPPPMPGGPVAPAAPAVSTATPSAPPGGPTPSAAVAASQKKVPSEAGFIDPQLAMLPARVLATNGTAAGGVAGGVHGFVNPHDFDGDGEITANDRRDSVIRDAMVGALGGRAIKGPLKKLGVRPFEKAAPKAVPKAATTLREKANEVLSAPRGAHRSIKNSGWRDPSKSDAENAIEEQFELFRATEALKDELGASPQEALELAEDIMRIKLDRGLMRQRFDRDYGGSYTPDELSYHWPEYFGAASQGKPVAQNGLPNIAGAPARTVAGGVGGGVYGWNNPSDWDGDGEISLMDRGRSVVPSAIGGAVAGRQLPKMAKAYMRGLDDSVARSVNQSAPQPRPGGEQRVASSLNRTTAREFAPFYEDALRRVQADEVVMRQMGPEGAEQVALKLAMEEAQKAGVQLDRITPETLQAMTQGTAQAGDEIVTNGIPGTTRKDALRQAREASGGSFPAANRPPPGGPVAPPRPASKIPLHLNEQGLREDLIKAGVVGTPIAGVAGVTLYNWYVSQKGEQNAPSFKEFMQTLDQLNREQEGLPPTPSLKPPLPN